ncbi:hypothetical protein ACMYSQ_008051 [Aspergillus niger]
MGCLTRKVVLSRGNFSRGVDCSYTEQEDVVDDLICKRGVGWLGQDYLSISRESVQFSSPFPPPFFPSSLFFPQISKCPTVWSPTGSSISPPALLVLPHLPPHT